MIITIDGPAGAGKSSISKALAEKLGFTYLDSGAMYRALALYLLQRGIDPGDQEQVLPYLKAVDIFFRNAHIFLNSEDVSGLIRTPEVDSASSAVSRIPAVRKWLTRLQQKMQEHGNIVAEGRDMGTVVFPDADYKFFLTASAEERARRRLAQMGYDKKDIVRFETILQQIKNRDKSDSSRAIAPLIPANDAIIIDSSDMSFGEVLQKILNIIRKEEKSGKS